METTIYFIRHAEPDFNVHDDNLRPLSVKGEIDAANLVEFFSDKCVDKIFSSPFKRAVDTVNPLALDKSLNIELVNDFRERNINGGEWIENFNGFAKKQWEDFSFRFPNGECLNDVQIRNIKALEEVLVEYNGKTIVIGSHGTALSTIINYFDATFDYNEFNNIKSVMPWIVKFIFSSDGNVTIENVDFRNNQYQTINN